MTEAGRSQKILAALADYEQQGGPKETLLVPLPTAAVERAQADSVLANERIVTAESRATAGGGLAAGLREALATINPAPAKKR